MCKLLTFQAIYHIPRAMLSQLEDIFISLKGKDLTSNGVLTIAYRAVASAVHMEVTAHEMFVVFSTYWGYRPYKWFTMFPQLQQKDFISTRFWTMKASAV